MSVTTQVPVYETVCVRTEEQLVGYRDPTSNELMMEEQFSSNVPSTFGYEGVPVPIDPYILPGYVAPPLNPPETHIPELPVPPGFLILLTGLFALWLAVKRNAKRA